jgi:hypothetical protein
VFLHAEAQAQHLLLVVVVVALAAALEVALLFLSTVAAALAHPFQAVLWVAITAVAVEETIAVLEELLWVVVKAQFVLFGPVTLVHSHQLVQGINDEPIH